MRTTVFVLAPLLLVPIIAGLSSIPVRANDLPLSLPQIIEYSQQNNGDLRAFREEKGIRDADKVRAALPPNPTLDFEAGTGALTGSGNENNLAIGVSREFSLTGKMDKRLAIAELELDIYRWRMADRERLLRDEVKTAFYNALLAKERLALTDRSIALNRQLLDVTKERLAAGDIPELEMNLVKVELARSEGTRIEVLNSMMLSQARLWILMGLPPGNQPVIEGKLESDTPVTKSLSDLKQLARTNRPDIRALGSEKGRGDADVILAEAERIPNLTAGLVLRRDTTAMEIGGVEGKETAYTIGVRLSMPIPAFDRNQAGIQEARAKTSGSETRLTAAVRGVEREVEAANTSLQNATSVLALYKADIIPQLEENLKLTQEAYRLGETGILAVIQEQKKFIEINEGYLAALHTRQTAFARLETVVAAELAGGTK